LGLAPNACNACTLTPQKFRGVSMRPLLLALLLLLPSAALADDELITIQSAHSAPVTVQRLQTAIIDNGWTILSKVDHAAFAAKSGIKIPARTTIAYAWMQPWIGHLIETPTVAIEVPLRVLVWEDNEGVWVTRDTMRYYVRNIIRRHEAKTNDGGLKLLEEKLAAMIDNVTR
jgi:uncharacterized protein (DUF302 family)